MLKKPPLFEGAYAFLFKLLTAIKIPTPYGMGTFLFYDFFFAAALYAEMLWDTEKTSQELIRKVSIRKDVEF